MKNKMRMTMKVEKTFKDGCEEYLLDCKARNLREGDTLIVTELDRLGRNKQDTLKELRYFAEKGVRVMILEIPTTTQDLSTLDNSMAKMIMETINNMLIELYATMAQAEIEKKEKRQQEGIEAKKARGEWADYGRPKADKPSNWDEVIERWKQGGNVLFFCYVYKNI